MDEFRIEPILKIMQNCFLLLVLTLSFSNCAKKANKETKTIDRERNKEAQLEANPYPGNAPSTLWPAPSRQTPMAAEQIKSRDMTTETSTKSQKKKSETKSLKDVGSLKDQSVKSKKTVCHSEKIQSNAPGSDSSQNKKPDIRSDDTPDSQTEK